MNCKTEPRVFHGMKPTFKKMTYKRNEYTRKPAREKHINNQQSWSMWTVIKTDSQTNNPETGWLQQPSSTTENKVIFSPFWRMEIQDQGPGWCGFWWEPSSWFVDGYLSLWSLSRSLSLVHEQRERVCVHRSMQESFLVPLLIKSLILSYWALTFMISFILNYFLRGSFSKDSHTGD